MSRNFTSDVETQREYFNASYFNKSGSKQIAKYETTLLKPFFNDPDKWQLAINRFRVPLSGIPLTRNNIPFQKWQVGLYYHNGSTSQVENLYVPQYNLQLSQPIDNYLNLASGGALQDLQLEPPVVNTSTTIPNVIYNVNPVNDTYHGTHTFYIESSSAGQVDAYQNGIMVQSFTIQGDMIPSGQTFLSISTMCTDSSGNFYCGYLTRDNVQNIWYFYIQSWTRSSATTWAVSVNYHNTDLTYNHIYMQPQGLIAFQGQIIVYLNFPASFVDCYYNVFNVGVSDVFQTGNAQANNWVAITDSNYIYRCSSTSVLQIGTNIAYTHQYSGFHIDRFLGFDKDGYLLIHRLDSSGNEIGYQAISVATGNVVYSFSPPNGAYSMVYLNSTQIYVDSGPYSLYTYEDYLIKINFALQSCFSTLKNKLGSAILPSSAPRIKYNASTKLFFLVADSAYNTLNSDGTAQYYILLNEALWEQFYFPSQNVLDIDGWRNLNLYSGDLTGNTIELQQETSTIYAFYDLTRIIISTINIPVSGDGEGKTFSNSGFSSNNSLSMITDVIPDTSTLSPSSALIYIPAGILRWYNLYAQQPFNKVDLIMYYETKDGNIYPIEIANGEYFSVKLEFKRGTGDF
ncbi:MAG: hypothetical protein JSS98_20265 [Bacteroidetes bacterium]|nr:hypothetical protein [Bacteroidota bacterium]